MKEMESFSFGYDWRRPANLLLHFMLATAVVMIGVAVPKPLSNTGDVFLVAFFITVIIGYLFYLHSHHLSLNNNSLRLVCLFSHRTIQAKDLREVRLIQEARGKEFRVPVVYLCGVGSLHKPMKIDLLIFNPQHFLKLLEVMSDQSQFTQNFQANELFPHAGDW